MGPAHACQAGACMTHHAAHPIEHALDGNASGWRASTPGEQIVRLLFTAPIDVRGMDLRVDENDEARTQEFVLRWSAEPLPHPAPPGNT
jgi:hypothetical protein